MAQIAQLVSTDGHHKRPIFVTGGAGFIGANFIRTWLDADDAPVVNLDKLTYAGNLDSLSGLPDARLEFVHGDIGDVGLVKGVLARARPRAVVNFAAESHVDRSIHGPDDFIATNVVGTFRLLECVREYWQQLDASERQAFRFLHVSTDEVYGSLLPEADPFRETNAFQPNSPYAASKASSDHLVRAWHHTYGLPVITTNCSNNYGPFQFPEKLIPLMVHNALEGRPFGLWRRAPNTRLALCRRSLRSHPGRSACGESWRHLQHWGRKREGQHRRGSYDLRHPRGRMSASRWSTLPGSNHIREGSSGS